MSIGARGGLLGPTIERRTLRHCLGRVLATLASITLGFRVSDTQCGAKFFRPGPALRRALADPFVGRWVFDVELLLRLTCVAGLPRISMNEVPLQVWHDVAGSKLRRFAMLAASLELVVTAD